MSNVYKISEGSSILLDLIRGITAQLVVIGHGIAFFHILPYLQPPVLPWMQNVAVLIFFILSGLLISYSTIRKMHKVPNYGFKHFFMDRFSRIYTAFIPALVFVFLVDTLSITLGAQIANFDLKTGIGNVFMLQDFPFLKHIGVKITSFGSARPFWTLAVEWWIYLFFGFVLLVSLKKKTTLFKVGILGVLSIVPFYNLVAGRGNGLFLFWLFGALVFVLLKYNTLTKFSKRTKQIALIFILLSAGARVLYTMVEYEAIFAFLLAMALLLCMDLSKNWKVKKGLEKAIRFHANYSYTLYLIHYSVLSYIAFHYKGSNAFVLFIVVFLLSNVLSALLGYVSEMYLTPKVKKALYSTFIKPNSNG